MFAIGLPAGGEFLLIFLFMGVIYACIRQFGADAQAGFGVASRVMQAIFLPAMAVSFAVGPVAGQNFGARKMARVRETFRKGAFASVFIMAGFTLLIQCRPELLVAGFTKDTNVRAIAAEYLMVVSWNFVAQGLIFACSGLFQGLGDTRPALWSSATRLAIFAPSAIWLASQPDVQLHHVWYLSLATIVLQALVSYLHVRARFKRHVAMPQPWAATAS
jgi:Na+-driven multidrug efflux pump